MWWTSASTSAATCVCECSVALMCLGACGARTNLSCHLLSTFHLGFWDRVSHWTWNSLLRLGWLKRGPQAHMRLCFPRAAITTPQHHSRQVFSHGFLRVEVKSSCLQGKHFTNWAITPGSQQTFWKSKWIFTANRNTWTMLKYQWVYNDNARKLVTFTECWWYKSKNWKIEKDNFLTKLHPKL